MPYFYVFIRISHFHVAIRYPSIGSDHHLSLFWTHVSFQGCRHRNAPPPSTSAFFFFSVTRLRDSQYNGHLGFKIRIIGRAMDSNSPKPGMLTMILCENNFRASGPGVVGCTVPLPCTLSALLVTHGIALKNAPVDRPCVSPHPSTPFPPPFAGSKCLVCLKSGRNKASGD